MAHTPDSDLSAVSRRTIIRDLAVFQVKLVVDGLRDLLLVPTSLVAGFVSLVSGKQGGAGLQFYHLLEWGKQSEQWINLFGALKNSPEQAERPTHFKDQGMDNIVERLEALVVDEYKSGGLTAQAKEQLDKLIRSVRRKPPE